MEIVEFKDYPNTETPLNSHNLNRMQNNIKTELTNIEQEGIIVSPTEPVTNRRKVWMQKGKNLFNSSFEIAQIHGETGNNESSTDVIASNGYTEVKSNVQYTISTNKYNGVSRVAFYDKNKSLIQVIYNTATFTTPDNAKYIRFSIWSSTTINQIDSDLKVQVEQGSTAADYEEYIEPKTYILNDNNVYEEFMKKQIDSTQVKHNDKLLSDILNSIVGDIASSDLNSINSTSIMRYASNTQNIPKQNGFADYGTVITIQQSFKQQICIGNWNSSTNNYRVAIRTYTSEWTEWKYI